MFKQVHISKASIGDHDIDFILETLSERTDLTRHIEVKNNVLEEETVSQLIHSIDHLILNSM